MRNPLALVAAALVMAGCGQHPAPTAKPIGQVAAVWSAQAIPSAITQTLELTGAVAAQHVAVVAAQQAGRITSLPVREGDKVKTGDTLGTLDASTYAAGADSALGNAQAAKDALQAALADIANADAGLRLARSSYAAAAAAARNAREHAARMKSLYDQGAVSREVRDDAVTAADQADAALGGAVAGIARAYSAADAARAHHAVAAGQAVAADGQAQQARVALAQTTITAPFDGVVTKRWLDIGAYTNPGSPVVTLESAGAVEIELSIPEEDVASVMPGTRLNIVVDALGGRSVPATVRALIPSAAVNSHQFAAKLDVTPTPSLLPGMFVRAQVAAHVVKGIGIPASALTVLAGQPGVFILDNHTASFQPVTVQASNGKTSIVTGVPRGSHVALNLSKLTDGEPIAALSSVEALRR